MTDAGRIARTRANPLEHRTPSPAPFIVGAGRSGTTLLRLMLDAHPEMAVPQETHFIPEVAHAAEAAPKPREAFIQALLSHPRWRDQHVDPDGLKHELAAVEPFDVGEGFRVFYRLYAERFGKPRWGDKTPPYQMHMPLIQRLLPEAHFVYMIRDGRDVALSIKDLWFGPNSMEEAAKWWVTRIERAFYRAQELQHFLIIRYEDLVLDTENTLHSVCGFLRLPWDAAMLDYYKTADQRLAEMDSEIDHPDGGRTISVEERLAIHAFTRRPPQASRIGRWRREMDPRDRSRFERIAGSLLRKLGYDTA